MSAEVVGFTGKTKLPEEPERLLEKAAAWGMSQCIVLGYREDGSFCMGTSFSEISEMVLLLRAAEHDLMVNNPKVWSGS